MALYVQLVLYLHHHRVGDRSGSLQNRGQLGGYLSNGCVLLYQGLQGHVARYRLYQQLHGKCQGSYELRLIEDEPVHICLLDQEPVQMHQRHEPTHHRVLASIRCCVQQYQLEYLPMEGHYQL